MPGISIDQIPESGQGGGNSVSDAEVAEAAAYLRENPGDGWQFEPQDAFERASDETKAEPARRRTVSAGGRARAKVAELLGVDESGVTANVRATETDAKGKPTRYTLYLVLKAEAIQAVKASGVVVEAKAEADEAEAS